jgi:hypothetical protein
MTWSATCSEPGMKTASTLPRTPHNLTMTTINLQLSARQQLPGVLRAFCEGWDTMNLYPQRLELPPLNQTNGERFRRCSFPPEADGANG